MALVLPEWDETILTQSHFFNKKYIWSPFVEHIHHQPMVPPAKKIDGVEVYGGGV